MKRFTYVILPMIVLSMCLVLTACGGPESTYADAQKLMSEGEYAKAAEKFAELGDYEEAAKLTMYCRAAAAGESGDFDTCFSGFQMLEGYKESEMMISYYEARQIENSGIDHKLEAAQKYNEIPLFKDSAGRAENCREEVYQYAIQLKVNGNYDDAIEYFVSLEEYKDCENQISDCQNEQKKANYNKALQMKKRKEYSNAILEFLDLPDYLDCGYQIIETKKEWGEALQNDMINDWKTPGCHVLFGNYYQYSRDTVEPIEWIVLDYDSETNRALLLSRFGLDLKIYDKSTHDENGELVYHTWENCSLRNWLNEDFLNTAFSLEEQEMIIEAELINNEYSPMGGNNTKDKVFLLGLSDEHYLDEVGARYCFATNYAISKGVACVAYRQCCWTLRSPADSNYKTGIFYFGETYCSTDPLYLMCFPAVRPAIWLDLNKIQNLPAQ